MKGHVTLNRNRLIHHLFLQWDYLVASNGVMNGIFHMYKDGAYVPIHRLEPYIKPYIYIDNQSPDSVRSIADGLRQVQSINFMEMKILLI